MEIKTKIWIFMMFYFIAYLLLALFGYYTYFAGIMSLACASFSIIFFAADILQDYKKKE